MAASILAVAGLIGLGLVLTGVIAPLVFVPIIVLAMLPFAIGVVAKLFANSQPSVAASTGPATPSTAEASYNPVNEPR